MLLIGGLALDGVGVQSSISSYYYTVMGDVFVGSLCAQGVFLISYRYRRVDSMVATAAGILVIAVALLPTAPVDPTPQQAVIGGVHLVCATLYYLTLAYYSYFIFTRTDPGGSRRPHRKLLRNKVYRVCGVVVVGCLVGAVITGMAFDELARPVAPAVLVRDRRRAGVRCCLADQGRDPAAGSLSVVNGW